MSARQRAISHAANLFAFQRDQHHGWRRLAMWLTVIVAAETLAFAGYIHLHSTVYIAVAATPDGRIIEMTPLDEPIMSDAALRNWTVSAVTEAFTLGHHDWRMRLGAVREHFTDHGYQAFVGGLEESLFLERLRSNLQVASAVARGAPVIISTHVASGRVTWTIEFPLLVTFQAGDRRASQDLVARVLVTRVPLSERARGIGIQQLIATRASA